jgi:glycosyltransferase involved in cell wall biosynthesis
MQKTRFTILIPALNEGRTIYGVIKNIPEDIARQSEIIVIDGMSSDDTAENSRRAGARVYVEPRKGKGTAVRKGFELAKGEFCILIDGDGCMDPAQIPNLVKATKDADLVLGSRFRGVADDVTFAHRIGNMVHNGLASLLFMKWITDINSGFKVIRTDVARSLGLKSTGFDIEAEMLLTAIKKGFRVKEVSIYTVKREHGEAKLSSLRDGLRILVNVLRVRLA